MSEKLDLSDTNAEKQAYDEQLFEDFQKVGNFSFYEYLTGDKEYRAEQKRQFLANEIDNPTLDYPYLDPELIEKTETGLADLKHELLENETNEYIKQA